MSESALPMKPIQEDFVETTRRAVGERDRAREVTARIVERGIDNVYFVGCGGSLYATYPVHFLLDTVAEHLNVFRLTSNEFNFRRPRQLGGVPSSSLPPTRGGRKRPWQRSRLPARRARRCSE